jgi:phospholipid transport system substrate-binding protein
MSSHVLRWILLAVLVLILSPSSYAETPMNTVKALLESVRTYKKETSTLTAPERAANAHAQKVVEETLSVQELSKQMLGPQWEKLNANDQKAFMQLLQDLLQKVAYPKSAEFFGDLQIEFVSERVNGKEAVVETTVSHPKEGQVSIEYKLAQRNDKWLLIDVLLDEVSLVTNVRTQMQQVISKESYQGLLKRMREKLAES